MCKIGSRCEAGVNAPEVGSPLSCVDQPMELLRSIKESCRGEQQPPGEAKVK